MSTWQTVLVIVGLGVITALTRSFFMLPDRELPMPDWARQGLRYAPLAALAAVIVPEIVMTQGQVVHTWADARIYATVAGSVYFFWRRGILGTIVAGMVVLIALKLGLGW